MFSYSVLEMSQKFSTCSLWPRYSLYTAGPLLILLRKSEQNRTVLFLHKLLNICVSSVCVECAGVFQMVFNVVYPMAPDQRRHVSINSARWLPDPGMGLAYGTNKGDLVICRPVWVSSLCENWNQNSLIGYIANYVFIAIWRRRLDSPPRTWSILCYNTPLRYCSSTLHLAVSHRSNSYKAFARLR